MNPSFCTDEMNTWELEIYKFMDLFFLSRPLRGRIIEKAIYARVQKDCTLCLPAGGWETQEKISLRKFLMIVSITS